MKFKILKEGIIQCNYAPEEMERLGRCTSRSEVIALLQDFQQSGMEDLVKTLRYVRPIIFDHPMSQYKDAIDKILEIES